MGTRYPRRGTGRYPTSKEAFDKLPHGEQWEIKVNLLTDNSVFLLESLNPDCVHDLVASGTLSPSEGEKVSARVRFDGRQEGIQELLKILPRGGDFWWRSLDDSLQKRGQNELYYRLNPWLQGEQHGASGEPPSPPSPSLPQGPADDGKSLGAVVQSVLNNQDMLRALVTELTRRTDPRGAPIVPPGPFSVYGSHQNVSGEEAGAQITQWNVSEKEDMGTLALNDKKDAMLTKKDDMMAMFTDESAGNIQPRSVPAKPEGSTQNPGSSADRSPPHRQLCLDTEMAQLGQSGEETTSCLAERQYTDKSSNDEESMTSIVENDMQPSTATNAATRRPSEDKKLNTATPNAPSLLDTLQQDQAQAVTKYTRQPEAQSGDPDDKGRGKNPSELSESGVAGEDGQERESLLEDGVTEQVSLLTNDNGRELLSSLHSDPQGPGGDLTATLPPSLPLPSAAPPAPASPSPSSEEGSNTSTHIVNHNTYINVNAPVRQLNVAKENRLTKQVSLSVPSTPTCNAQGGWEETQEGADPVEQDPYDDTDMPASAAQPRSCFAQETNEETAIQSQDHSQSDQGLNGTGNLNRAGPESSYYPPWNLDAQQTALKVVCTEETIDTENQQEHIRLDYEPCSGDAGRTDMSFVDLSYTRNTATQLNTLSDSCEAALFSACVTRTQADNDAASQQTDYAEISGGIPQGRQRRQEMGHSGEADNDHTPSVSEDCDNQTVQVSHQHISPTRGWPFFAFWTVIKEGLSLLE